MLLPGVCAYYTFGHICLVFWLEVFFFFSFCILCYCHYSHTHTHTRTGFGWHYAGAVPVVFVADRINCPSFAVALQSPSLWLGL